MKKIIIVGCGAYLEGGYGCPGEWRCLKAAALGTGKFAEPAQVVGFVRCDCPGRNLAPNVGMAIRLSEIVPDEIRFSTCLAGAEPGCPYATVEDLARIVAAKTGVPVVLGTHEYPCVQPVAAELKPRV